MLKPMRWMIIPSMLSFSTLAFAGGVPTDLPSGADSSGKTKTSATAAPTKASKTAKAKSTAAKKVAKKITKASSYPHPQTKRHFSFCMFSRCPVSTNQF